MKLHLHMKGTVIGSCEIISRKGFWLRSTPGDYIVANIRQQNNLVHIVLDSAQIISNTIAVFLQHGLYFLEQVFNNQ